MNTAKRISSASRTRNRALAWTRVLCGLFLGVQFQGTAAANQVLLYTATLGTSHYQTALDNRGYSYQLFTDDTEFDQAVQNADPVSDVVVVDAMQFFHTFDALVTFVQSGGHGLLQYWNLTNGSALASVFQVTVSQQLTMPLPTYDWGGSPLFAGVGSPLSLVETGFSNDVVKLQPTAGGQAIAGFTSSPSGNQAAMVLGHSGRSIVHGFFIEDFESPDEGIRFAQNELDYLFGALAPSSSPSITTDPRSQTLIKGGSGSLRIASGGSLPLFYQWRKDGANIFKATNDTYSVANAQSEQAGAYTVMVSNFIGSVTSSVAMLTVANIEPVTDIQLFVDGPLASPYETALADLSLPYQKSTDDSFFAPVVAAANPANTLLIVDAHNWPHHFNELTDFVAAGGRAILQFWNLTAGSHLASAFKAAVAQQNTSSLPVYAWKAPDLFASVGSPIFFNSWFFVHGQKLQSAGEAQALAGFSTTASANQAAIVLGNSGRTLVNGFILEEAAFSSQAELLVSNEVRSFFPLGITSLQVSNATATLSWITLPGRSYQVQSTPTLRDSNWTNLGDPISATETTARLADTSAAGQRYYRVVLLP